VKASILIWIVLYFFTGAIACSTGVGKPASISQEQGKTTDSNAMVQRLLDEKVVAFYQWEIDTDTTLLCIARDSGRPKEIGEPNNIFSIIDRQGKLLYQIDSVDIGSISSSSLLRNMRSQLVVDVNEGGRMSDLKILDYQNGKITELLDEDDQENLFALIKPQFRSGVIPAQEPYEVLMIRGGGLASPGEKYVSVYRYADGSYEFNGEISQKLLDNHLEQLLKKKTH
jgi:hypothetical protein